MPPRGLEHGALPLHATVERMLYLLDNLEEVIRYQRHKLYSTQDVVPHTWLTSRNERIIKQYQQGVSLTTLANQFKLSPQRIYQIVHGE